MIMCNKQVVKNNYINFFMERTMRKIVFLIICISFILIFKPNRLLSQENENNNPYSSFSQSMFAPDISFILDFSTVYRNLEDEEYERLELPGLTHAHEHGHSHSHAGMNAHRGFNLNYGEVALYASVDPYFELFTTFHLGEGSFEIEEVFINSTSFPFGFQLKIGKFLSSFGRLNSQHAHFWDFSDQPLIYSALFGHHGIIEKGVQISWLAPIDLYLLIGGEIFNGDNENSFGTNGFQDYNGIYKIEDSQYPDLNIGFIKTSIDVGKVTMVGGVSMVSGKSRINHDIDEESGDERHGVDADTLVSGCDLTIKYFIDSYRYISMQSEYLYRYMSGYHFKVEGTETDKKSLKKKQSGLYSQLIIKPFIEWRMGIRYDLLQINSVKIGGEDSNQPDNLFRVSAMLDYNPTEFTRIRLQYNYDKSKYEEDEDKLNHEVIIQFNVTIGAHGAHPF